MNVFEIVLAILWAIMAIASVLNWRAQIAWHRHYEERLGPAGITKSPVILREDR